MFFHNISLPSLVPTTQNDLFPLWCDHCALQSQMVYLRLHFFFIVRLKKNSYLLFSFPLFDFMIPLFFTNSPWYKDTRFQACYTTIILTLHCFPTMDPNFLGTMSFSFFFCWSRPLSSEDGQPCMYCVINMTKKPQSLSLSTY